MPFQTSQQLPNKNPKGSPHSDQSAVAICVILDTPIAAITSSYTNFVESAHPVDSCQEEEKYYTRNHEKDAQIQGITCVVDPQVPVDKKAVGIITNDKCGSSQDQSGGHSFSVKPFRYGRHIPPF